uniref:Uncharacterized protein n=1 Tax=Heterorhabditis bacteriophora TaxID=37862 RepID=A0A1I7XKJ7_HETBA
MSNREVKERSSTEELVVFEHRVDQNDVLNRNMMYLHVLIFLLSEVLGEDQSAAAAGSLMCDGRPLGDLKVSMIEYDTLNESSFVISSNTQQHVLWLAVVRKDLVGFSSLYCFVYVPFHF